MWLLCERKYSKIFKHRPFEWQTSFQIFVFSSPAYVMRSLQAYRDSVDFNGMFAFMEIFVNLQWVMFSENSSQCKSFWKEVYMYHCQWQYFGTRIYMTNELANAYIHVRKQAHICWVMGGEGQNFIKGVGRNKIFHDCGNGKKIHKNLCDIIMY